MSKKPTTNIQDMRQLASFFRMIKGYLKMKQIKEREYGKSTRKGFNRL